MIYDKLMKICLAIAVIAFLASTALFATTGIEVKEDVVLDKIMVILINIQKYSWPVAIILLIYALYQYYVVGSEAFEFKVNGQRMIMGLSIFMAILQSLPLAYAFITIGL
ncbi:MAG: hypothetical protein IKV94_03590 [Clostridia bacterium]|nr:hypothetical protein [Clostridia bacterium]